MAIRVKCPNPACGKEHDLKAELAGKTVRCSFCQQVFTVPPADGHVAHPPSGVPPRQAAAMQSGVEPPHSKDPLVGKQVAYYKIESLLGKGGMGKVYKAQNLRLAKTCAIKILPPEVMAEDATMAERFVREARAAAVVQHPNVLPVHNVAKAGENYFIEMDYVDGGTLHGLMRQRGRLDVKEAARIIRDVAAGLSAAHEKGIIHRDIKPSNVMLTSKGHVYVMDFGLAKAVQSQSGLTQQGCILGTPWYMSPEQAALKPLDHRSDIYSLGVMFYQILTGSPPYTADSPLLVMKQHESAPIPDITQVLPGCAPVIAAMIRKMMAKDPAERYQSCAEIVRELNDFLSAPVGTMAVTDSMARRPTVLLGSRRIGAKKRSAAPAVLVLVLLLVLVLGGVAYFVVRGKKGSAPPTATRETTSPPAPSPQAEMGVRPRLAGDSRGEVATAQPSPPSPLPAGEAAKRAGAASQGVRTVPPAPAPTAAAAPSPSGGVGHPQVPQAVPQASPRVSAPLREKEAVDLVSYLDDIKPVNEKIDSADYDAARSRANLLKAKYPDLVAAKLANLDRIESFRKRCFERVNSGAAKVSMEDVSRKYAFAGEIQQADEKGLKARIPKRWDAFTKEEIGNFYRRAADPKSGEDFVALAAFWLEGETGEMDQEQAVDALGKASGLGTDVLKELKYIETLKQAQKQYADAEARGKQLATAQSADSAEKGKEGQVTARSGAEGATTKQSHKSHEIATAADTARRPRDDKHVAQPPSAVQSFGDVYVTIAATGDKIPHPLSKKTTKIIYQGKRIDVPEGMVCIPAGSFKMGEGESEHQVYLDAYFIGKYEVTNAEWKTFVDATAFPPPQHWIGGTVPAGRENHPVVYISWDDIQKYCEWVSNETGNKVSLPTEAQWEKAARGPKGFQYPWGNDWNPKDCNWQGTWVGKYGLKCNPSEGVPSDQWTAFGKGEKYTKEICRQMGGMTMPVGSFPKGKCFYGCYDMAGNASEWCQDWFTTNYYKLKDARKNPEGPTEEQAELVDFSGKKSKARVLRGGSWHSNSGVCRTVYRSGHYPTSRNFSYFGFRLVLLPSKPEPGAQKPEGSEQQTAETTKPALSKGEGTQSTTRTETKENKPEKEKEESAKSAPSAVKSFDDVYVTTAATGDKIPHPLSRKTYKIIYQGKRIDVPEGMVFVPAGKFKMGENESEHEVYLDAYFIGKYEVTNAEWKAFVDATAFTPPQHWIGGTIPEGKENHPVVLISWEDIQKYCEWVSNETGSKVSLPTEAQWEKAARGPKGYEYPWGNEWNPKDCNWQGTWAAKYGLKCNPTEGVPRDVWNAFTKTDKYTKEICARMGGMTMSVGSFPKDKCFYGCYDMAGNASEWCEDWFTTNYYKLKDAKRNPEGPTEEQAEVRDFTGKKSKARVLRGGAWGGNATSLCRVVHRSYYYPSSRTLHARFPGGGFRLAVRP